MSEESSPFDFFHSQIEVRRSTARSGSWISAGRQCRPRSTVTTLLTRSMSLGFTLKAHEIFAPEMQVRAMSEMSLWLPSGIFRKALEMAPSSVFNLFCGFMYLTLPIF